MTKQQKRSSRTSTSRVVTTASPPTISVTEIGWIGATLSAVQACGVSDIQHALNTWSEKDRRAFAKRIATALEIKPDVAEARLHYLAMSARRIPVVTETETEVVDGSDDDDEGVEDENEDEDEHTHSPAVNGAN